MAKAKGKYFILTSAGVQFEISRLDFNKIKGRIARGQVKGWYVQRGETIGDRHDWAIQFEYIASCWSDSTENEHRRLPDVVDPDKYLPPKVGKVDEDVEVDCHDWNDDSTWKYVSTNYGGNIRYFKQCVTCGKKSILIKKREVELAMEKDGLTIDDVPFVE